MPFFFLLLLSPSTDSSRIGILRHACTVRRSPSSVLRWHFVHCGRCNPSAYTNPLPSNHVHRRRELVLVIIWQEWMVIDHPLVLGEMEVHQTRRHCETLVVDPAATGDTSVGTLPVVLVLDEW